MLLLSHLPMASVPNSATCRYLLLTTCRSCCCCLFVQCTDQGYTSMQGEVKNYLSVHFGTREGRERETAHHKTQPARRVWPKRSSAANLKENLSNTQNLNQRHGQCRTDRAGGSTELRRQKQDQRGTLDASGTSEPHMRDGSAPPRQEAVCANSI